MSPSRPEIPLTVIGGYLGAGKTTLLNRMLGDSGGRRLAVLVNDFGAINIDAGLVRSRSSETISLTNGCVCCSMGGELLFELAGLRDRDDPPEHVVIEASGVGDPAAIAMYGDVPGYRRDGIVVVVDASTVSEHGPESQVGLQVTDQLRAAHLIVLNKSDLAAPDAMQASRERLRGMARFAEVFETSYAEVPTAFLLGAHHDEGPANSEHRGAGREHPDYVTWSWSGEAPVNGTELTEVLPELPEGVMRGKGFLCLQEDPENRYEFQLVGRSWHIKRLGAWGELPRESQLVLIGLPGSVDTEALDAKLAELSG
ncbi:MAG: GTP-binding protein [Actinomycetota bacterium]|nr:GTP-binding protein [Actinomycetota bacterium]